LLGVPPMRVKFDGGTVLLEGEGAGEIAPSLPGIKWDARVGAYRAPGYVWPRIREVLVRQAGQAPDGVRPAGQVPDGVRPTGQVTSGWTRPELRPYQEAALLAWQLARCRGLVALPTGSGKTHVALAAMAETRLPTLCLVPTRVLLHQWHQAIAGCFAGPVGRLGDGIRDIQPITITTFESAYRTMNRLGNRFGLLVVDEAHHFGMGVRDEALEMSVAGARIGLTATMPGQGPHRERLEDLIGPVVYELTIGDLSGRFLAPFELVTLHVDLTPAERLAHDSRMAEFRGAYAAFRRLAPGAPWDAFCRHAMQSAAGRRALAAWREARRLIGYTSGKRSVLADLLARHADARVLVFTGENDSAYAIARDHLIMPVTCDIGRVERDEVLGRFRRGELRALVSARVLNEGIDVPDADVAIVVSGAMGEREHVQRVGRVLRPAPGKRAVVYELVARGTSEPAALRRRRRSLAPREAAHPHP